MVFGKPKRISRRMLNLKKNVKNRIFRQKSRFICTRMCDFAKGRKFGFACDNGQPLCSKNIGLPQSSTRLLLSCTTPLPSVVYRCGHALPAASLLHLSLGHASPFHSSSVPAAMWSIEHDAAVVPSFLLRYGLNHGPRCGHRPLGKQSPTTCCRNRLSNIFLAPA